MINGAVNAQLKHPHSTTTIIIPNSDSEKLNYLLNIPKTSTKDLRFGYSTPNFSKSNTHASCFVSLCNSAQFKIWFTLLYYPPPQSSNFSSITESLFKSFNLLLFQFYLKENSPKYGNIFSGVWESLFGLHITKITHHS